jgi:hypothetical protein
MKHLKKYNESVDGFEVNKSITDYIKLVFADLIGEVEDEFEF